jgi:hypothetical protein
MNYIIPSIGQTDLSITLRPQMQKGQMLTVLAQLVRPTNPSLDSTTQSNGHNRGDRIARIQGVYCLRSRMQFSRTGE